MAVDITIVTSNIERGFQNPVHGETRACGRCVDEQLIGDNFCRHCGRRAIAEPVKIVQVQALKRLFNWWTLGGLLLCAVIVAVISSALFLPVSTSRTAMYGEWFGGDDPIGCGTPLQVLTADDPEALLNENNFRQSASGLFLTQQWAPQVFESCETKATAAIIGSFTLGIFLMMAACLLVAAGWIQSTSRPKLSPESSKSSYQSNSVRQLVAVVAIIFAVLTFLIAFGWVISRVDSAQEQERYLTHARAQDSAQQMLSELYNLYYGLPDRYTVDSWRFEVRTLANPDSLRRDLRLTEETLLQRPTGATSCYVAASTVGSVVNAAARAEEELQAERERSIKIDELVKTRSTKFEALRSVIDDMQANGPVADTFREEAIDDLETKLQQSLKLAQDVTIENLIQIENRSNEIQDVLSEVELVIQKTERAAQRNGWSVCDLRG